MPVVNYIQLYYFEINKGLYLFYNTNDKTFDERDNKEFKLEVLDKLNDKYMNELFKTNCKTYLTCSKINKPRIFEENNNYYLNMCYGFLHKNVKPYNEYSKEIQDKVNRMLQMCYDISCNKHDATFEAYKKYLSQICKGEKTKCITYRKSVQGTGKSFEQQFLIDYVLGPEICLISNTEPLLKDFNKILMGKLYVVFEELPIFNSASWEAVSSKLKTLSTENKAMYRGLYKEPIQAENISNFTINTNCESLKDSAGRRIIILDIGTSHLKDYEYFNSLSKDCFHMEVGEAFYSYMINMIDTTDFNAQRDFPELATKQIAIVNQLKTVENS